MGLSLYTFAFSLHGPLWNFFLSASFFNCQRLYKEKKKAKHLHNIWYFAVAWNPELKTIQTKVSICVFGSQPLDWKAASKSLELCWHFRGLPVKMGFWILQCLSKFTSEIRQKNKSAAERIFESSTTGTFYFLTYGFNIVMELCFSCLRIYTFIFTHCRTDDMLLHSQWLIATNCHQKNTGCASAPPTCKKTKRFCGRSNTIQGHKFIMCKMMLL